MAGRPERPVLTGIAALVGVGLVLGVILSLVAVGGTRVLGLGGGGSESSGGTASDGQSMYLPKPSPTETPSGPLITLAPGESSAPATSEAPTPTPDTPQIVLEQSSAQVSPMDRIDLRGTYTPQGDGAVLEVQRFDNGDWADFYSVDTVVTGSTFSTYVQTGQAGEQRFRMYDPQADLASNEISVTIG